MWCCCCVGWRHGERTLGGANVAVHLTRRHAVFVRRMIRPSAVSVDHLLDVAAHPHLMKSVGDRDGAIVALDAHQRLRTHLAVGHDGMNEHGPQRRVDVGRLGGRRRDLSEK